MIPLFKVRMSKTVDKALCEVLHSGYIGEGKKVKQFELELVPFLGTYLLALNCCTSALKLALKLLDVGPGDEVISSPMTCTATNMPIVHTGAKLVWADVCADGNISVLDVMTKITDKTKVIVVTHWGGNVCDLEAFKSLDIPIIQDAAHAFGARYKGMPISFWSRFTCFSFQAIKHLTSGDGGILACQNYEDVTRGRLLRWYGIDRETERTDARCEDIIKECGYKIHMNDINATIGLANYNDEMFERDMNKWVDNANYYRSRLGSLCAPKNEDCFFYPWLMSLLVPDSKKFIAFMRENKIECSKVHVRNDLHTAFESCLNGHLPGVEFFSEHQVSIPVGWWVTEKEREYIADKVLTFLRKEKKNDNSSNLFRSCKGTGNVFEEVNQQ